MAARWRGVLLFVALSCVSASILLLSCRRDRDAAPRPEGAAYELLKLQDVEPLDGVIIFDCVTHPVDRRHEGDLPSTPRCCALDLRQRLVTDMPTRGLVFDPEGEWVLGHGGYPICLLTESTLHRYLPPEADAAGAIFDPLNASHIFRGPDLASTMVGGTQVSYRHRQEDLWTFAVDPDITEASRRRNAAAPVIDDWAFGASADELYVCSEGRILKGRLDTPADQYQPVVDGSCPAVARDGTLAYTGPDLSDIRLLSPDGKQRVYSLGPGDGTVVDIQWAPHSVGRALLYQYHQRPDPGSKPIFDSAPHLHAPHLSILNLDSGRHIAVLPGDYPGLDVGPGTTLVTMRAQWVAALPDAIRERLVEAAEVEKPADWPPPTRCCRVCRNLARQFAADCGYSTAKVDAARTIEGLGSDGMSDPTLDWSKITFRQPDGVGVEVAVRHRNHFVDSLCLKPQGSSLPSPSKWLPREALEASCQKVVNAAVRQMPWPMSARLAGYGEHPAEGYAKLNYSLMAPVGDMQAELVTTLICEVAPDTSRVLHFFTWRDDALTRYRDALPTERAVTRALKQAAKQMSRSTKAVAMRPTLRLYTQKSDANTDEFFWDTVVVARDDGTGLHGEGRQWALVRLLGGDEFTVHPKIIGYTDPVPWLTGEDRATNATPRGSVGTARGRTIECRDSGPPVWTSDGSALLFVSLRQQGDPSGWLEGSAIMRLDLSTNAIECVDPAYERAPEGPIAVSGDWLLTSREPDIVVRLNLRNGHITSHRRTVPDVDPKIRYMRGFALPKVSPDGRHFAYVTQTDRARYALFVGAMPRKDGEPLKSTRVSDAYGWVQPVFPPKGNYFYFARPWPPDDPDGAFRHCRFSVDRYDFASSSIADGRITLIAGNFHGIENIHIVPDGRLLVADPVGPVFFDPATGKTGDRLGTPSGGLHYSGTIAVSPDGKRIAFRSSSGSDPSVRNICVCNLDGSNARRVTPPMPIQVKPYVFPESGKSALDAWFAFETSRTE